MKKLFALICVFIMCLPLSGCWGRKEPKTLAIVNSAVFDLTSDGKYEIIAEILNPQADGNGSQSGSTQGHSITMTSQGETIPEALRNISENLGQSNFGTHNKVRFYSISFASSDVSVLFDYLFRSMAMDENPYIVVINDPDPIKIYDASIGLSQTVGEFIYGLSKVQPTTISESVFVETQEFVRAQNTEGRQPVAGLVELVENKDKSANDNENKTGSTTAAENQEAVKYKIRYAGLAAFKDNKLVGFMDETQARAYNLVTDKVKSSYFNVRHDQYVTVLQITDSSASAKTAFDADKVTIDVTVKVTAAVTQETGVIDVTKADVLKTIEQKADSVLKEQISEAIKKAQTEFQSDIFGFGVDFHIQHPDKWREIKQDWDSIFASATINVTVKTTITSIGEYKWPYKLEGDK